MKVAAIILALVAVTAAVPRPLRSHRPGFGTKIIGGEEAKEKEFPFSVVMEMPVFEVLMPFCSGAIYDETRIITSATCAQLIQDTAESVLIAGAHDISNPSGEEQFRFHFQMSGVVHEDFNEETLENDIGILTLASPLTFTDRVQPIRLAQSNQFPSGDVVTCGHGIDKPDEAWRWYSPLLLKASLKTISHDECNRAFENVEAPAITNNMVCAVAPQTPLCYGDAGNPLIAKDEAGREYLAGVATFYEEYCSDVPGVFTAIAPFRQWLDSKLNP